MSANTLTARQRVLSGNRKNWKVGQLVAFVHGPGRANIYRFRVTALKDGKPSTSTLVGGRPWSKLRSATAPIAFHDHGNG